MATLNNRLSDLEKQHTRPSNVKVFWEDMDIKDRFEFQGEMLSEEEIKARCDPNDHLIFVVYYKTPYPGGIDDDT